MRTGVTCGRKLVALSALFLAAVLAAPAGGPVAPGQAGQGTDRLGRVAGPHERARRQSRNGGGGLRVAPRPLASPRIQRKARRGSRRARPARARLSLPHRAARRGSRSGSTWQGRLVLKGYGDPTLTRGDLRRFASAPRPRHSPGHGRIRGDRPTSTSAARRPAGELLQERIASAVCPRRRPGQGQRTDARQSRPDRRPSLQERPPRGRNLGRWEGGARRRPTRPDHARDRPLADHWLRSCDG